MEASCHTVYREKSRNAQNWATQPTNSVEVIVREWNADYVYEYLITVFVVTNSAKVIRKEISDGDLAKAVRRGIAIFDEEVAKHPYLGIK